MHAELQLGYEADVEAVALGGPQKVGEKALAAAEDSYRLCNKKMSAARQNGKGADRGGRAGRASFEGAVHQLHLCKVAAQRGHGRVDCVQRVRNAPKIVDKVSGT